MTKSAESNEHDTTAVSAYAQKLQKAVTSVKERLQHLHFYEDEHVRMISAISSIPPHISYDNLPPMTKVEYARQNLVRYHDIVNDDLFSKHSASEAISALARELRDIRESIVSTKQEISQLEEKIQLAKEMFSNIAAVNEQGLKFVDIREELVEDSVIETLGAQVSTLGLENKAGFTHRVVLDDVDSFATTIDDELERLIREAELQEELNGGNDDDAGSKHPLDKFRFVPPTQHEMNLDDSDEDEDEPDHTLARQQGVYEEDPMDDRLEEIEPELPANDEDDLKPKKKDEKHVHFAEVDVVVPPEEHKPVKHVHFAEPDVVEQPDLQIVERETEYDSDDPTPHTSLAATAQFQLELEVDDIDDDEMQPADPEEDDDDDDDAQQMTADKIMGVPRHIMERYLGISVGPPAAQLQKDKHILGTIQEQEETSDENSETSSDLETALEMNQLNMAYLKHQRRQALKMQREAFENDVDADEWSEQKQEQTRKIVQATLAEIGKEIVEPIKMSRTKDAAFCVSEEAKEIERKNVSRFKASLRSSR